MEKEHNNDTDLLEAIKRGDPKTMEKLYGDLRKPFIAWATQSYTCDEEDIIEMFQKAFTILYLNVRKGRLTQLTSSVRTYMFSIGKNLFREFLRNKNSTTHIEIDTALNTNLLDDNLDTSMLDKYQNVHQKETIRDILSKVPEPCNKLLRLVYIHDRTPKEIVDEMGYSDERVVRKRKSVCLKNLRELLIEQRKNQDDE